MTRATAGLVLHGFPVSNYFNIAHAALLEKRMPFEVVTTRAAQTDEFLARSAMGKIPFLETPHGCIAETVAILEYLEEAAGGVPLLPADPGARARARQLINIVQVYVEIPVRSLFPGVFFGASNQQATVDGVEPVLDRAMGAIGRLAVLRPFLTGESLSTADLFAFHCFDIAERVVRFVYRRSLIEQVAGLSAWRQRMAERDSSRIVLAAFAPAFAEYLRMKHAAYREPEL